MGSDESKSEKMILSDSDFFFYVDKRVRLCGFN